MANSSFLTRWSKRKLEGDTEPSLDHIEPIATESEAPEGAINDDEQPEQPHTAAEDESIASLLVSEAAKETKKAALRKLFLSGEFSEVDRLNDYDHDYSAVKPLASEVAQKLRDWLTETNEESEENRAEEHESELEEGADLVDDAELLPDITDETKNTI